MLVLDNADDLAALTAADRMVADGAGWLRTTRAGTTLVTGRSGEQRMWGPLAVVHRVGPLDDDHGGRVLADLAPTPATRQMRGRWPGG